MRFFLSMENVELGLTNEEQSLVQESEKGFVSYHWGLGAQPQENFDILYLQEALW